MTSNSSSINNSNSHAKSIEQLENDLTAKYQQIQIVHEEIKELKRCEAELPFDLKVSEESKLLLQEKVDKLERQVGENTYSIRTRQTKKQTFEVLKKVGPLNPFETKCEHYMLPWDTYTFFAIAEYCNGCIPTKAFVVAIVVLIMQLVFLAIFVADVFDYSNRENIISVPPGVGLPVRISQLLAILISSWSQDEIRTSFNVLQLGYDPEQVAKLTPHASCSKWYLSIFLRIFTGCLSLTVTFVLIVNSTTVRDVMLDFTAVTFVSQIDNGAFLMANWNYMGAKVHDLTVKTKTTSVKNTKLNGSSVWSFRVPRLISMIVIVCTMCGAWAWITIMQSNGHYMDDTIFVQFGDDFSPVMAAFSGLYRIEVDGALDGMRVTFVELNAEKVEEEGAVFYYCIQDSRWMFRYGENPNGDDDFFSRCWYRARSSETEDLDITQAADVTWFVSDEGMPLEMPLQHFFVISQESYYGRSCESDSGCGDRMRCEEDENNEGSKSCVCEEGYFGLSCEFRTPCRSLEIEPDDLIGFVGTRTWSRTYTSVLESGKESPIQVYGKPVFFGDSGEDGTIDVMLFNGRRWILTDTNHIEDYENLSSENRERNLAEFLANNFHAYWSNYTFYFASEPVNVGTPTDSATPAGLQWFRFEASGAEGVSLRSGRNNLRKISLDVNLFCAVCNDELNPCFYGATCEEDGTCTCTTGSSGKLCQISPDGNGFCDMFFNTPQFTFDGGDCCSETCRSSEQYDCGHGMIENDAGVSAYGYVGYPNCQDPRFSKLQGSTTLFKIFERGTVRCGSDFFPGFVEFADGVYSGFEVDLCKSVAAAVFGDPEAVEIIDTSWGTRFTDLAEEKFDVLIMRTTHTAERDIYQSNANAGFSFVPIPALYDGLRFGGIPPFIECADELDFASTECLNLKICVAQDTTWQQVVESLFPDSMIVKVAGPGEEYQGLEEELCNVIAGEISQVAEFLVRDGGFTGPSYEIGENMFSKEPLSAVTRQDDRVWSKFVSWVFEALIQAEESGITQATADNLAPTDVFGEQFRDMFRNAVGANGNYGEIYARNLGDKIPRSGLNNINTGNSGSIYAFPFGSIETRGVDPIAGGSIEAIRNRGTLNCGIKAAPGFAEFDPETGRWVGFEIDLCRGIAAALFSGSPNVNFIPLPNNQRFPALAEGVIDVLTAGTTHTLTRDVRETITGEGFDFTPAVFHDGMGFGGRSPFVWCAENLQFNRTAHSAKCFNHTIICAPDGSTWLDAMRGPLSIPDANIFVVISQDEAYERLISGDCNVIAGESTHLSEATVRGQGYPSDGDYVIGTRKFTKEPLAVVSRSDDDQFSDFLRWIVFGFFHAAEQGITRDEAYAMPSTSLLFGYALSGMWRHAIEVVGNYDEMFERNFAGILEREGLNNLNNANGPQFFAKPGVTIIY